MASLQKWIVRMLLVITVGVLPVATIDCDFDDGELDIDIDGWHRHGHDDYWYNDVYYYEDYYYEPWGWWF